MTAPSALLVGRPVPWASPVLVLATMGAAVATLLSYGTPGSQVASYGAYWVLGMVLPGTLVSKALLGTRGSWLVDLTLGALTGLMLELFAWAAFVGLDAGAWLRLWPLASLLVFAFRRARGRVLQRPRAPWPFWPSVTVAGAIILDCYHVGRTFFASYDLPPSGRGYYVDLPWHMGLAWEATRGFPLVTPQAVGEGLLKYSWFVHAHLGAASLVTAIDVPTIVLRLWPLPVLALVVLSTAVLGHQVSGRPWVGALAAWIAIAPGTVPIWQFLTGGGDYLTLVSPTMVYSLPLTALALYGVVDLLRRGPTAGGALVAALGALGTAGSKSSAILMLVCGVALVACVDLVVRRTWRRGLVLTGAALAFTALSLGLLSGGGYGSSLQLFSGLTLLPPYRALVSNHDFSAPFPAGLLVAEGAGWWMLPTLLLAAVIKFARQFAFVLTPALAALRRDVSAWLLAGFTFSAWVPFLLLSHRGYSQYYFIYGVVPAGSVLGCWALADLIDSRRGRGWVAFGVATGTALGASLWAIAVTNEPAPRGHAEWHAAMQQFVLVGGAVVLGLVVAGWAAVHLSRRRGWDAARPVGVALVIGPLAAGLVMTLAGAFDDTPEEPPMVSTRALAEGEAGVWIQEHVPLRAVLATNNQCLSGQPGPTCYGRSWWISGIGGRRVLLEGWQYTEDGANGPMTDLALYDLNAAAFAHPSPDTIGALKAKGVTWLVTQDVPSAEPAAPLDAYAVRRYDQGGIAVYELR